MGMKLLATQHKMKIELEIQPHKNFIKLFKRFKTQTGETRTKNKKIEIADDQLYIYTLEALTMEVAAFEYMP
jgi:hypothetical protein